MWCGRRAAVPFVQQQWSSCIQQYRDACVQSIFQDDTASSSTAEYLCTNSSNDTCFISHSSTSDTARKGTLFCTAVQAVVQKILLYWTAVQKSLKRTADLFLLLGQTLNSNIRARTLSSTGIPSRPAASTCPGENHFLPFASLTSSTKKG